MWCSYNLVTQDRVRAEGDRGRASNERWSGASQVPAAASGRWRGPRLRDPRVNEHAAPTQRPRRPHAAPRSTRDAPLWPATDPTAQCASSRQGRRSTYLVLFDLTLRACNGLSNLDITVFPLLRRSDVWFWVLILFSAYITTEGVVDA